MKKIAIIQFLLMLSIGSICAQDVSYTYDNAGNRIKRELYVGTRSHPTRSIATTESLSMVHTKDIKIYPNPTEGFLKIEISGLDESDDCEMKICSLSGQELLVKKGVTQITEMDIRQYSAGVYLLNIKLNDESSTWKILKK